MSIATVYKITCVPTSDFYIGCTTHTLKQRWYGHTGHARHGSHESSAFQMVWDRFGPTAFRLEVIEECATVPAGRERERFFISTLRPTLNMQLPPAVRGCRVADCDRPHKARGYCSRHYRSLAFSEMERRPKARAGTEVREPMTFKVEPSFRRLIEAVATTTNRKPSEVVRDLVVSHFGSSESRPDTKAS